MRVLVTGGTGFVGRHLIDALLRRGDTITVLVRTPRKAAGLADLGVRCAPGDLSDSESLRAAARNQDAVYHVAGVVAARYEAEFLEVNRDGTARLAAAVTAESPEARVILVSSMAAGGPTDRGARLLGTGPSRPLTAYGRSKLAGEDALRTSKLRWSIVRPPAVYGPGDTEMLRVFKAVRLGFVPVFGDGNQELSLVYGPDLGQALAATGHSDAAIGGIYYACHPEIHTSRSLVATIAAALGRQIRIIPLPRGLAAVALRLTGGAARLSGRATLLTPDKAQEFFAPAWTADAEPLAAAAGWRAAHDLAAGAAATAAWYRTAGWL